MEFFYKLTNKPEKNKHKFQFQISLPGLDLLSCQLSYIDH